MVFAAGNLIDIAVRGSDWDSVLAVAALTAVSGLVFVLVLRPRVAHTENGLRIVNPLRNTWIPWKSVTEIDVTDVLRVHVGEEAHRVWALREKRRRPKFSVLGGGGTPTQTHLGSTSTQEPPLPVEFMADQLRNDVERRAITAQGEAGTVRVEWSPVALLAVVAPVLALLAAIVLG